VKDKFFVAEQKEEWDGQPLQAFTTPELHYLYTFAPQWHAVAEGPVIPFLDGARAKVAVDSIFTLTREDAIEALWYHVRQACARENLAFEQDDWRVLHVVMLGGN
jgi:hypothetical protein